MTGFGEGCHLYCLLLLVHLNLALVGLQYEGNYCRDKDVGGGLQSLRV